MHFINRIADLYYFIFLNTLLSFKFYMFLIKLALKVYNSLVGKADGYKS